MKLISLSLSLSLLLILLNILIINSFEFTFLKQKKDSNNNINSNSNNNINSNSNSNMNSNNDIIKYYTKSNGKSIDTNSNEAMIALHTYFPPYPVDGNNNTVEKRSILNTNTNINTNTNTIINIHTHGTSPTNGTDIISHPIALIKCNNQVILNKKLTIASIILILILIDPMYIT